MCKRVILDPSLTSYTKINSKWNKGIHRRSEPIKLLEQTGGKLHDFTFGNDFLGMTLKAQTAKAKTQVGLHQIKKILHSQVNKW